MCEVAFDTVVLFDLLCFALTSPQQSLTLQFKGLQGSPDPALPSHTLAQGTGNHRLPSVGTAGPTHLAYTDR